MDKPSRSEAYTAANKRLPELDRGELELLRTRINALLHLKGSEPDAAPLTDQPLPPTDDALFLLASISDVLRQNGLEFADVSMLQRSNSFASFRNKTPGLMEYLSNAAQMRQHQLAIFRLGVWLLYKDMTSRGLAVSARTLMNSVHRVPAVINAAFPGYASSGMLHLILVQDDDNRRRRHARAKPHRHTKANAE